jgi:hypothetical protein
MVHVEAGTNRMSLHASDRYIGDNRRDKARRDMTVNWTEQVVLDLDDDLESQWRSKEAPRRK